MSTKHAEMFENIVLQLQAAKRKELETEIKELQKFLGSEKNLLMDQRKVRWAKEAGKRTFLVTWRSSKARAECTVEEAAEYVGRSVKTLVAYLNRGKGQAILRVDDDVVTVMRR